MRKIALTLLSIIITQIFFPIGESIHIEKRYTYASEESVQRLYFEDSYEPTAGLWKGEKPLTLWKRATGEVSLSSPKNMFVFKIPKTFAWQEGENSIRISLKKNNQKFPLSIDTDGDGREEGFYYTEPIFLDKTDKISYSIETKSDIVLPAISAVGLDTESDSMRITFNADATYAEEADTYAPNIIKRADWGADESFRYSDSPIWKGIFAKMEGNKDTPKSEATLAYEEKIRNIRTHLSEKFPDQDTPIETIRENSGHPLIWPIEKTKKVEKIVFHHTAEDNTTNKDDLALIRGIYYYHAIVRGWGDIGYNYLIGQRGQVYEGRAGGDYSVAAHALWNNKSVVGVSVMGNFMQDSIVSEQEQSVKSMIAFLSKKYGIDLHKTSIGHRECKKDEDCLIGDFEAPNLIGHRDVGYTTCPGTNFYTLIERIRSTDTLSHGLTYRENPTVGSIKIASASDISLSSINKGPTIKIRLSYMGSTIRLKSYDSTLPRLTLGKFSGTLKKNIELPFEASGTDKIALVVGKKRYPLSNVDFSANLIIIPSWDHKPSWDSFGAYNDNIFRGKISLVNEGGNLVVINELPIEDYLRGLAEISNGDNEEKMKTILVAARSYAYFYSNPENRKFLGKAYDGSDNPDEFQKYLGYGYEKRSPATSRIVDATNGQIITYEGEPIKPWYFNESDGQTVSAKEYCENQVKNGSLPNNTICKDIPYLQSVSDPGGVGHTQKGHGVGISGIGATYLAANLGFKYEQIIPYYLDGTKVEKKY